MDQGFGRSKALDGDLMSAWILELLKASVAPVATFATD
jgi:hypothetical protein